MDSYSTLLNLNFMSSLRTDNIVVDMFLAALIPFLSSIVYKLVYKQWPEFLSLVMHAIFHSGATSEISRDCSVFSCDLDENDLLREAVMQYVGSEVVPTYPMGSYNYKRIPACQSSLSRLDDVLRRQYAVHTVPSRDTGVVLRDKMTLSCSTEVNKVEEGGEEKTLIRERVIMDSSCSYFEKKDPVMAFVKESFEWYKGKVLSMKTQRRYLYQPLDPSHKRRDDACPMVCQRYPLCEEKSFNTLFFKEKQKVLNLLNDFTENRGKFCIPGFPHKLVLLLHGPPGTGKTSLVKAIAQHTKRSILAISLSRIQTNRQLISWMFDPSCELMNSSSSSDSKKVKLKTESVVYMLEDIDAAGKEVVRKAAAGSSSPEISDSYPNNSTMNPIPLLASTSPVMENVLSPGVEDNSLLSRKNLLHDDPLSVAGLLDALNGILDSPNRIVVMTTNHLEHLDPSLTRPGVVTFKLRMGDFNEDPAMEMIHHYFCHIKPQTEQKIVEVIRVLRQEHKRGYSPAEIEQLCAENDTAEDLLEAITSGSRVDIF